MLMKKSSDTIGNRTRDLPACSAVPKPTAPPREGNTEVLGENAIPVPLCPPQILQGRARDRTRASVMRGPVFLLERPSG
jgi:hypothetical protein